MRLDNHKLVNRQAKAFLDPNNDGWVIITERERQEGETRFRESKVSLTRAELFRALNLFDAKAASQELKGGKRTADEILCELKKRAAAFALRYRRTENPFHLGAASNLKAMVLWVKKTGRVSKL